MMERYVVTVNPSPGNPKPIRRTRWKRAAVELNGLIDAKCRRDASALLVQSYTEIGAFPHLYHIEGQSCPTHMGRVMNFAGMDHPGSGRRYGVSALEFDNQGIYLASVTKSGCLMVHDFESLYCQCNVISPYVKEDEAKHLLHLSTSRQLDAVRWNPSNQDEVACTSLRNSEIHIFDVSYISPEPVEILRKRPAVTIHGCDTHTGLPDFTFSSTSDSRVIASDTTGYINLWDRKMSHLPCLELTTNSRSAINSIQLDIESQILFGAGKQGTIYMWDLRGGRTSAAFLSHKEAYHPPITSMKLTVVLEKIESLKAQSDIVVNEIQSISLDPTYPYRLAFHLDNGWSGVLDVHNMEVTHIHCPPPAWLEGSDVSANLSYLRKPSWSSKNMIYAVGSSSNCGLHLLDFYPDSSSSCHVDYRQEELKVSGVRRNRMVALSEGVTACAMHPCNDAIVAGTKQASLLMISQKNEACKDGDDCPAKD